MFIKIAYRGLDRGTQPGESANQAGRAMVYPYHWLTALRRVAARRRRRRVILRTAARFDARYPVWQASLFDTHFFLNRGQPVIERHLHAAGAHDATDLAQAWAEQWPTLQADRRTARLQELAPIAADFLRLLDQEWIAS